MKNFLLAIFMSNLPLVVYAADKPGPVTEKVAVEEDMAAAAEESKQDTPKSKPAAAEPEAVGEKPALPPKPSVVEKATPAETGSEDAIGFTAPLKTVVTFHENETQSLKELMRLWDEKAGPALKRRRELEQDVQSKTEKVAELQSQKTKAGKKEASGVKREISRLKKDIQAIDKSLKSHRKELGNEIRELSRSSQESLKDSWQQAINEIQKPHD